MAPIFFLLLFFLNPLQGQTLEEKRAALTNQQSGKEFEKAQLERVNQELRETQEELHLLHQEALYLFRQEPSEEEYRAILQDIQKARTKLRQIEERWHDELLDQHQGDLYGLWHQPWTSLEQLIIDYGSPDYLYLIPPEIGGIRLSVASSLLIPRESWDRLLTTILATYGVGIRELTPSVRQLYLLTQAPIVTAHITNKLEEVEGLSPTSQVCFIFSPPLQEWEELLSFLGRLIDHNETTIERIGEQLCLLSSAMRIKEIVRLCSFLQQEKQGGTYRLIHLHSIAAKEMDAILNCHFEGEGKEKRLRSYPMEESMQALFLSGPPDLLQEAEELVALADQQLASSSKCTLYTYHVRHSDPATLATTLGQVYSLLKGNKVEISSPQPSPEQKSCTPPVQGALYNLEGESRCSSNLAINPIAVTTELSSSPKESAQATGNFVVYPKTGTIVMVVEEEYLPELTKLLKRLDIPKKMVRIDVLFFEKKLDKARRFGLDLLRLNCQTPLPPKLSCDPVGCSYDNHFGNPNRGIFQFMIQTAKKMGIPAYDATYNFLLSQQDVRINNNPSVTTVNQRPATIQLVEEISIDNGLFVIDPNSGDNIVKQSFTRTQYGIVLKITPTIHSNWDEAGMQERVDSITLETDVLFDTPMTTRDSRPPVIRRRISNEVRVADGETLILGGLRSLMSEDNNNSLPFLGELPYIGKFFGSHSMADRETEMFVFITPHIVRDPKEEVRRVQSDLLCKRPGDHFDFLSRLTEARNQQKRALFEESLTTLFGQSKKR